jgi:beta-glucosidase
VGKVSSDIQSLVIKKSDFPASFTWGVATSSFQIEGAGQQDGRGPSIWDTFCETPAHIADQSNGLVACDHYNRLDEDLDLIASLGVKAYRFSISWPRVQPLGQGAWNEAGFDFYERLVDGLRQRGIEAFLTLYHWDLPQALQDQGGWNNRDICQHFCNYACEVVRRLGDRVATVCTHNEPWVVSILGHETGIFAPGLKDRKIAYQVGHHLLLSHGMALQAIRAMGYHKPLGIVLNQSPIYPASQAPEDVAKARLDDGIVVRWYMDPLLKGAYPADVIEWLGDDAPVVHAGDMAQIAQPLDFIGVNYYTRNFSCASQTWDVASTGNPLTEMGWEIYPPGLTELLTRLHADYTLPAIYITENGGAFKDPMVNGEVDDQDRLAYLHDHIQATHTAMAQGVDVRGYFVWSLMDNFEWASGYEKRFGIVHVDYASLRRTLKQSALWYQSLLKG